MYFFKYRWSLFSSGISFSFGSRMENQSIPFWWMEMSQTVIEHWIYCFFIFGTTTEELSHFPFEDVIIFNLHIHFEISGRDVDNWQLRKSRQMQTRIQFKSLHSLTLFFHSMCLVIIISWM